MNIVVLVKQVPDTANVGSNAMKEDGTVNRAVLDTIFNPDDLNALEMALSIKDRYGATITVITMGPPRAVDILKESLYRGADKVYLVSDAKFAGSDTLATSLILKHAIVRACNNFDVILAGRQAIDGDTAQVGPQIAEKLKINQVCFVTDIEDIKDKKLKLKRFSDYGTETIEVKTPVLLTIEGDVNKPRPAKVKNLLKYKNAVSELDLQKEYLTNEEILYIKERNLSIPVLSSCDLAVNPELIGLSGSPTRVKNIDSVVFKSLDSKTYEANESGIKQLMKDLVKEHIIG